jgi:hypothetical protein
MAVLEVTLKQEPWQKSFTNQRSDGVFVEHRKAEWGVEESRLADIMFADSVSHFPLGGTLL